MTGWPVKIIARVNYDKLLLEMSEQEIANVIGKNTPDELRVPTYGMEITGFEVGMEYKVTEAWYRLRDQARAAEQLKNVSKTLAALSDLVLQTEVQFTSASAPQAATPTNP